MKLVVMEEARFSCQCCAKCCRGWHVELLAGEKERLDSLRWPAGDPLQKAPTFFEHAGKQYLPHQADGSCVFLNASSGLCRIHEQFGEQIKPLGCQLYPFRIVPTFKGEATVTFRYDCPAARRNEGAPIADSMPQLKRFAQLLVLPPYFDNQTCNSFKPEQIEAACEFLGTLVNAFDRNEERVLFITTVCDWLKQIAPESLDRPALAAQFAQFKTAIASALASPARKPGLLHRVAFRTLLGIYLRRDEDILNGHASRFARLLAMCGFVIGIGSFVGLGVSYPVGSLRRSKLFGGGLPLPDVKVTALHWEMVKAKLASLQFMGSVNPRHDMIAGLRSLALLYPLVIAAARFRAANRDSTGIDETDIDFAVGVIEHSFGRSAVLQLPFARSLEKFLLEPQAFANLVRMI